MPTWDDIKQWNESPVGKVGDALTKARNSIVGLQDEVDNSATPKEWHGPAADASKKDLEKHRQAMEVLAAEIGAMAEIVDVTEADVKSVREGIAEVESWASKDEFAIESGGKVVDKSTDSSGFFREMSRIMLQGAVDGLISSADDVDKDLVTVMDKVLTGKITDGGATTLDAAAKEGAEDVKLAEILENYQQDPDPGGLVTYPPIIGKQVTKKEAEMLDKLGVFGMKDMYDIQNDAFGTAGEKFPGQDGNDSHQDAFRHAYWNALMTRKFGADWAKEYATAHEGVPGNPADREAMDLHNNEVGRRIATENPDASPEELANLIQKAVNDGETVVIDKNGDLQYSDEVKGGETGHANDPAPEGEGEAGSDSGSTGSGDGSGSGSEYDSGSGPAGS